MGSLKGILRFETNQSSDVNNVEEKRGGIIYRRSLLICTNAKFTPQEEYRDLPGKAKAIKGVSPMGDALRPANAAFFDFVYAFMGRYTIRECRNMIGEDARREVSAWRVMREACGLSLAAPPTDVASAETLGA